MKKVFAVILTLVMTMLVGCGQAGSNVETLKGWSFQYNEGTSDYSLFFGLCDKNDKYLSADCSVDIRIENENGDIVYEGTKSVTKDDFGTYTNQIAGDRYLADVRIASSEIQAGSSSNGTVYFTVTNGSTFSFDECNCDALYCLPVEDIQLTVDNLPVELEQKDYDGSIASRITITDVQYSVDSSYGQATMSVVISGEKTYGKNDGLTYDIVSYKLCDSEGYVVDSGDVYIGTSLNEGDKFKDDSLIIYDLTPGESYTLQLMNYEW